MNTTLLAKLLVNINDLNNMKLLLKAIFTSKELKEFDNRLKIFQLLMQGKKHREISEELNVGIATVTRGSLAFEKEKIFKTLYSSGTSSLNLSKIFLDKYNALNQIKVLAYGEKSDWILETKYNIGKKRKTEETK